MVPRVTPRPQTVRTTSGRCAYFSVYTLFWVCCSPLVPDDINMSSPNRLKVVWIDSRDYSRRQRHAEDLLDCIPGRSGVALVCVGFNIPLYRLLTCCSRASCSCTMGKPPMAAGLVLRLPLYKSATNVCALRPTGAASCGTREGEQGHTLLQGHQKFSLS